MTIIGTEGSNGCPSFPALEVKALSIISSVITAGRGKEVFYLLIYAALMEGGPRVTQCQAWQVIAKKSMMMALSLAHRVPSLKKLSTVFSDYKMHFPPKFGRKMGVRFIV